MVKIKLYRGMSQKLDLNYSGEQTGALRGYLHFTDNKELAEKYAENGFLYSLEIDKKELDKDIYENEDEDRALMFDNGTIINKTGSEGKEFLIYIYHPRFKEILNRLKVNKVKLLNLTQNKNGEKIRNEHIQ